MSFAIDVCMHVFTLCWWDTSSFVVALFFLLLCYVLEILKIFVEDLLGVILHFLYVFIHFFPKPLLSKCHTVHPVGPYGNSFDFPLVKVNLLGCYTAPVYKFSLVYWPAGHFKNQIKWGVFALYLLVREEHILQSQWLDYIIWFSLNRNVWPIWLDAPLKLFLWSKTW